MNGAQKQASEYYIVGLLLAFTGGFLDVYTYVCRGGVFANAQTGNIVLLAINIAEGKWSAAGMYLMPILAFVLGIMITEYVHVHFRMKISYIHWRHAVLLLQLLVLMCIAFVPGGTYDHLVNVAVSFVCSLQVEAFRTFGGRSAYATTMCTGNLRTATELLYYSHVHKDKWEQRRSFQYYGVILVFLLGAVFGRFITEVYVERAVIVVCAFLLAVFVIMFKPAEDMKNKEE